MNIENYRPITVLNIDYKSFTKALSKGLNSIANDIRLGQLYDWEENQRPNKTGAAYD